MWWNLKGRLTICWLFLLKVEKLLDLIFWWNFKYKIIICWLFILKVEKFLFNHMWTWSHNIALVFQGLPSRARLAKMNITASNCIHCNMEETIKHMFWDCPLAKAVWSNLSQVFASFVGNQYQWEIAPLGDDHHCSSHLVGLWHVVRVSVLFNLWKARCSLFF